MSTKLRVFFDGACPMCRKEIDLYMRIDKAEAIDWCDVSQNEPVAQLPLPRHILLERFHVQMPDGVIVSGARGFIEMWRQLPGWRWLAGICSIPGLPSLLEFGYKSFLKVRPAIQRVFR